jgi:hypothetical protein
VALKLLVVLAALEIGVLAALDQLVKAEHINQHMCMELAAAVDITAAALAVTKALHLHIWVLEGVVVGLFIVLLYLALHILEVTVCQQ